MPDPLHRNRHGQVWLNVASAHEVLPEYANLDNSIFYRLVPLLPLLRSVLARRHVETVEQYRAAARRASVLLHDCRRRLPYAPGSVDHILCSHFLEHVYPDEADVILADFHRVLRPGGTLHVIVPSLSVIAREYVDGRANADVFLDATILSSSRKPSWTFKTLELLGYDGLKHRWMYDEVSIQARVLAAGFEPMSLSALPSRDVRAEDGPRSIHVAARKAPLGNSSPPS